ncbi:EbsA family protein [Streptococcus gallinaceus]|uniref:Pore forming protein ebsA n=1 Tax=Streptococcus gallinaceus TaxID=165758 RepID=A0ABV2JJ35_9STRE|nr:EbsA family protein [Streptococcus gallinaceus]MCP1639103.1 hypothetical protein [Streptococcus gallinaceus]MCP1769653.1 hypothetical protein [Streptococcus gallinaceus]
MIKIFGKVRYHWQPELSWSIIYWSAALSLFFIGLSMLFEKLQLSRSILGLFGIFVLLALVGLHRYFVIEDENLEIASVNLFAIKKIPIKEIEKVSVTYLSIELFCRQYPNGKIFYMRKWPKKYFVNALALNPHFGGEVELSDHLIKQDYFEEYYAQKD